MKFLGLFTEKEVKKFIIIFYIIGILGFIFIPDLFQKLIPFSILLSAIILFSFHSNWNKSLIFGLIIIAILGYIIEAVGTNYGFIFGKYHYTNTLGFSIFNTPLIIGINWAMLIYCTNHLVHKIHTNYRTKLIIAPALMTIFDIFLEPIAVHYKMWIWNHGDIPLQNYLAWWVISTSFVLIIHKKKQTIKNNITPYIFYSQLGFFIILNLLLTFRII